MEELEIEVSEGKSTVSVWAKTAAHTGMDLPKFRELIKFLDIDATDDYVHMALYFAYRDKKERVPMARTTLSSFVRECFKEGLTLEQTRQRLLDKGGAFRDRSLVTIYSSIKTASESKEERVSLSSRVREAFGRGITKDEFKAELTSKGVEFSSKTVDQLWSSVKVSRR